MKQEDIKTLYFKVPNEIFELGLNVYEIAAWVLIRRYENNGIAYPSYKTIAEKCGMSERQAIRVVKNLFERGLITKTPRKKKNGATDSNLYENLLPKEMLTDNSKDSFSRDCESPPVEKDSPLPSFGDCESLTSCDSQSPHPRDCESLAVKQALRPRDACQSYRPGVHQSLPCDSQSPNKKLPINRSEHNNNDKSTLEKLAGRRNMFEEFTKEAEASKNAVSHLAGKEGERIAV